MDIAILASGRGTNAENIIRFALDSRGQFRVRCVLTDNPRAGVIKRCRSYGVPIHVVPATRGIDRDVHEKKMLDVLGNYPVDVVCLAGFMRLLGGTFLGSYDTVVNIHPSWLPEFPGLGGYERAFRSGQNYSGVTVHYVDEGIDTGEIIVQEKFCRDASDDRESFEQRGRQLEQKLYPLALEVVRKKKCPSRG